MNPAEINITQGHVHWEDCVNILDKEYKEPPEGYSNKYCGENVILSGCGCCGSPWAAEHALKELIRLANKSVGYDRYSIEEGV